jgi:hypothetical protein
VVVKLVKNLKESIWFWNITFFACFQNFLEPNRNGLFFGRTAVKRMDGQTMKIFLAFFLVWKKTMPSAGTIDEVTLISLFGSEGCVGLVSQCCGRNPHDIYF